MEDMDGLISKKEILAHYGISYGALYRWKRLKLIPEEWFIKKSASTGQETYFEKALICPRIEEILSLRDSMSLEEMERHFNGGAQERPPCEEQLEITHASGAVSRLQLRDIRSIALLRRDGVRVELSLNDYLK